MFSRKSGHNLFLKKQFNFMPSGKRLFNGLVNAKSRIRPLPMLPSFLLPNISKSETLTSGMKAPEFANQPGKNCARASCEEAD